MDRRKVDVVMSAVLIMASIIILTNDNLAEGGMETDLGSLFLPRVVAFLIIVFAAAIGIQSLYKISQKKGLESTEYIDTRGFWGIGIYILIFLLYWFIVPYVGFLIATPLAMFSIALLLGGRRFIAMTVVSVATSVFVFYGCSQYLRVFLPTWSLF